ncbi:MAG: hypothetical protein R3178_09650 [Rhodothermales bacterium]|nr:hypothetical protein [Rhodothermales bacterium]
MIWFVATAAAVVLVFALIRTMRQFEQQSAAAALEQVAELTELTLDLQRRIENLEAIVTSVDVESSPSEVESDSSARIAQRTQTQG